MTKRIMVIGSGPAGVEAAKSAAKQGAAVTLIGEEKIGGRAGWHSLLPSKVWLGVADAIGLLGEITYLDKPESPDLTQVLANIQNTKTKWYQQQLKTLQQLGVTVVAGHATFVADNQVQVDDETFTAEAIIIASGSVPIFPPALKPDGQRVIAPRFASKLESIPAKVVVIGGGATGCEFAYLFNRLGATVTWLVDESGVLPQSAPSASQFLAHMMTQRGVTLVQGQRAERLEREAHQVTVVSADGSTYEAGLVFVAIGRKADLGRLNVAAAGLSEQPTINEFGQTENPNIYLVGDATGQSPLVVNQATAQAWVAGQHAAGGQTKPFNPHTVIKAIYTEPQVAEVGQTMGEGVQVVRAPYQAVLKSHLLPEGEGFVELYYNESRQIVGGVAAGSHAADVLAPVALAIQTKATLDDLAAVHAAHPTITELAFVAARLA